MPSAAKLIEEKKLDINTIIGTGVDGRVTKGDVLLHLNLDKNNKLEEETSKPQRNILKGNLFENFYADVSKIMMLISGLIFTYLCVKSFIFARKNKL